MNTIGSSGEKMTLWLNRLEHAFFISALDKIYEENYRGFCKEEREVLNNFHNALKSWMKVRESQPIDKN